MKSLSDLAEKVVFELRCICRLKEDGGDWKGTGWRPGPGQLWEVLSI